ncbi:MAG: hypothetical protein EHM57_07110, partial [Actinobacteria bacterium]
MIRAVTPEDLWALERVGQPEPLPDGSAAVTPVTTFDEEHPAGRTRLWLFAGDGARLPLTRSDRSASGPAVSPDGRRLAFLAKAAGGEEPAQVQVMPLTGGEAEQVAILPLGARAVRWLPDGRGLVVSAPLYRDHPTVDGSAEERERRRDGKPQPVVTEDRVYRYWKRWLAGDTVDHLFRIDLEGGDPVHLTPWLDRMTALEGWDRTFDVSPDGTTLAMVIDVSDPAWDRPLFAVHTVSTEGGAARRI